MTMFEENDEAILGSAAMTYSDFLQGHVYWHRDMNGVKRGARFVREQNSDKPHIDFMDEEGRCNGFAVMNPVRAREWFLQATGVLPATAAPHLFSGCQQDA
jgi:hypothetical protein